MAGELNAFAKALARKPLLVSRSRFTECQRLLKHDKHSLANATELIMFDPGLCLMVLRHSNKIRSRSGQPLEITSISSAVNLLGENAMRNLIGGVTVLEDKIEDERILSDYYQLLDRSYHAARFSNSWSEIRKEVIPEVVGVAAVLRDIGEIALCAHHHSLFYKIRKLADERQVSLSYASNEVLGFSLNQLSAQLAKHWFLPEEVRDGMVPARCDRYRAQGVMLASECARLAEYGWYHRDIVNCEAVIADYLNTSVDQVCRVLHQTTVAIARRQILHRPSILAAQLVQQPYEVRECFAQRVRSSATISRKTLQKSAQVSSKKMRSAKVYAQCIQQIKTRVASDGASVNELVKNMLYGLSKGVNMPRVAFAMSDAGGASMSVKMAQGIDAALAKSLVFPCIDNTLFSLLMKSPRNIWINPRNIAKYLPLIPDEFSQQVLTGDFICSSIFRGDRPLGLVYCDRAGSDMPIDDGAFQSARALVSFTCKAIASVDIKRRAARKIARAGKKITGEIPANSDFEPVAIEMQSPK